MVLVPTYALVKERGQKFFRRANAAEWVTRAWVIVNIRSEWGPRFRAGQSDSRLVESLWWNISWIIKVIDFDKPIFLCSRWQKWFQNFRGWLGLGHTQAICGFILLNLLKVICNWVLWLSSPHHVVSLLIHLLFFNFLCLLETGIVLLAINHIFLLDF